MLLEMLKGKIHRATVKQAELDYVGSITIDENLLKAAGISKGSSNPKTTKVGHISKDELRKIAEYKLPDLNCNDVEAAMRIIAGTARNMGIVIDD